MSYFNLSHGCLFAGQKLLIHVQLILFATEHVWKNFVCTGARVQLQY